MVVVLLLSFITFVFRLLCSVFFRGSILLLRMVMVGPGPVLEGSW